MPACLPACLPVYLSVYLSIHLSIQSPTYLADVDIHPSILPLPNYLYLPTYPKQSNLT